MTDLDDKLKEIVEDCAESYYPEHEYSGMNADQNKERVAEAVTQIKELYAKEVMPKANDLMQDMVNLHANMKQDMLRLGLTSGVPGLYSGQEWYERFEKELKGKQFTAKEFPDEHIHRAIDLCIRAAKKASGIQDA